MCGTCSVVRVVSPFRLCGCSGVLMLRVVRVVYVYCFFRRVPRLWVRQFFPCAGFSGCRVVVYGEIYFIMSLC